MKTIGMPVTHAARARPDLRSHTVRPRRVSAARSWFEAPKIVQNTSHAGTGLPAASVSFTETKTAGKTSVATVAAIAAVRDRLPRSSWIT